MRLSQEQYEELLRRNGRIAAGVDTKPVRDVIDAKPKRNKHGNMRITVDGKKFDSKLEARYYKQLHLEWLAGDVKWFIRQVPFELEGGVKYVADFMIIRNDGERDVIQVCDCKGKATRESLNKIKQVKARYGITVEIIKSIHIAKGITV